MLKLDHGMSTTFSHKKTQIKVKKQTTEWKVLTTHIIYYRFGSRICEEFQQINKISKESGQKAYSASQKMDIKMVIKAWKEGHW